MSIGWCCGRQTSVYGGGSLSLLYAGGGCVGIIGRPVLCNILLRCSVADAMFGGFRLVCGTEREVRIMGDFWTCLSLFTMPFVSLK